MKAPRTQNLICAFWALSLFGFWNRAELLAQRALGGAELENGCQVYADKAVKDGKGMGRTPMPEKARLCPSINGYR